MSAATGADIASMDVSGINPVRTSYTRYDAKFFAFECLVQGG